MLSHDGLEIAEITKIPRVLAGFAVQDSESSGGVRVLSVSDGPVWRRIIAVSGHRRYQNGQLPDFCLAG